MKETMSVERCILGTAGLGGVWGPVDPQESVSTILLALERGINAIDTAPAYGDAEKWIGEALRSWCGNRPQISTKVGRLKSYNALEGNYDYSDYGIWKSVEQSLSTLDVEAVDILFLHEPDQIPREDIERVIQSLLKIKEKGYAKKIGLGGNPPDWFSVYLQPEVFDVIMEYNKLNVCNTIALKENLPYCLTNNIQYFVASPLNMGLLGDRFADFAYKTPVWLPDNVLQAAIAARKIADEYQIPLRNLAHRFLLSLPFSFKIVIGACNKQQLNETIKDFRQGPLEAELTDKLLNTTHQENSLNV
jgi:D-threo-aldose 1-dehydrogenase